MEEMVLKNGKYELTLEYVKNNFDISYYDDGVLSKRIAKNTRVIYNYIYSHTNSRNKAIVDKLLNTDNGYRYLLDVLSAQIEADLENGYNDLTIQMPVDIKSGNALPREELFRNQVCVQAEQILDNSRAYFNGINILYQGVINVL